MIEPQMSVVVPVYSVEKEYFEEGLQQIRTAFGTYDHVILTDESIWHALSYSKNHFFRN